MVGWRNPARYLAPLAIAAVAAVAYVIVHSALGQKPAPAAIPLVQTTSSPTHAGHTISIKSKFYVVRPNDTLSKIAVKTGIPLSRIESLNPNINPDALHPSQRLRLR